MLKNFINWYFNFLKKWYLIVFIIFLGLSGYLGYLGTKIEMRSDFIDLLSEKNKVMQNMRKVFQMFGGEGFLICTLELKHPFYGIDENYRPVDDTLNALKELIGKWDAFDRESTKKFLPAILTQISISKSILQDKLQKKLQNIDANLTDQKAKTYNIEFLKSVQQSLDILNKILTLSSNQSSVQPLPAGAILKNLLAGLNSSEPDKAFEFISNSANEAQQLVNKIRDTIKAVFINHTAIEKAADNIAKSIQEKNIPEVKFVSYRKPIKWMKDNFFYLVEYQDLVGLRDELKKIHLGAFRVLGSDKFQGIRNILNKYSVNIGGDNEDESAVAAPITNNAQQNNRHVNSASVHSTPKQKNEYEYRFNSFKDMLIILIKPSGRSSDLDYSRNFITKISEIIRDSHPSQYDNRIEYGLTGRYVKKVEDADVLNKDVKYTSIIAIILIIIVIFIYFRRVRAIFATMIPLFTGLMCALGIAYIFVGYFNIITGFVVAILSGLGIDFGIHMLARYYEERKEGYDSIDALKKVFTTTLNATFTAATTTAFAFLCLVVTDFKGFSQFGFIVFLGLILIVVAMFITFPCILLISEKIKPLNIEKLKKGKEESLSKLRGKKYPFPYTIAAAGLLLIIISLFFKPQFNFDFSQLRSTDSSFAQKIAALKKGHATGQQTPVNVNNPSGVSSDGSDALESRIGESFHVSLWPSIVYTSNTQSARELTNSLTRRAQYTNEVIKIMKEYHFMNFIKKIYNQPEAYSQNNMSSALLAYLDKMKNEVTLDILSNYIKKMNASNYNRAISENLLSAIRKQIKLSSVTQYIENVARNLTAASVSNNSNSTRSANGEENEENYSLDVPNDNQTAANLSENDKRNLETFFNQLIEAEITGIEKFIIKPYDYKKMLLNYTKWIPLLSNDKAQNALITLYSKIKNSITVKTEALKQFIEFTGGIDTYQKFIPVQKILLEILHDGYNSYDFYKRMGLSDEYSRVVNYLIQNGVINLDREIDGDLYKALNTKPYNFRNIIESLRIIFNEIDSITRYVPDDQIERKKIILSIQDILTDNKFIKKIKDKKDKNMITEAQNACKNTAGVKYSDLPDEISTRFKHSEGNSGTFIFIYPATGASMSDEVSIQAYSRYLASLRSTGEGTVLYASETVIFANILSIIKKDGWLILLLTSISIIALLLFDFRTLKSLLYTTIPLLGGVALMFLFMRMFNVKINYLNAAVLPVILGVGIDEGIHIYHRYIEEGYTNLWFIIRTTGFAVFMADFTTAIGFAALMFANYRGLRTMGHLAVIGIMTAFFVAVTLLPALLQILENRKNKKLKVKAD